LALDESRCAAGSPVQGNAETWAETEEAKDVTGASTGRQSWQIQLYPHEALTIQQSELLSTRGFRLPIMGRIPSCKLVSFESIANGGAGSL
jgi:hypothetical protein